MNATIDTLATYEAIAAAGIDDRGARAISKAIADSSAINRDDLSTKVDVERLETKVDNRIAEVRIEMAGLKELIASTQNKTIVWMFGMLVTFSGIIIAAIKLI